MMSSPPLTIIVAYKLLAVTMTGLVMHGAFADSSLAEDQRAHLQPPPPSVPPPSYPSESSLFYDSSTTPPTTPTTTTAALLQGKRSKEVGPSGSFAIPLKLVKQPSGWGMVGEILAGDDYGGLSYRVMFDPQTSSTFLFDHTMKKFKNSQGGKIFTKKAHLYNSKWSIYSDPIPGDKLADSWFELSLQDGSRYQGEMIADSMEFDKLIMKKVNFGTVTYMNDAAASTRSGTFDGIVGLGFEGFTQGDDATCILSRIMLQHPADRLGEIGLERRVFSIYISRTGNSGEIRFGGTNRALMHHTFIYHNIDLLQKATRSSDAHEEESSNDSNESHHRAGSVTTIDSDDEEASDDRLIGMDTSDDVPDRLVGIESSDDVVSSDHPLDGLVESSDHPLVVDGVESSGDEEEEDETRRGGGSSRGSSSSGSSTQQYHDAHQDERNSMQQGEEEAEEGNSHPFSGDVSAPSPKKRKTTTMPRRDWMWGFNGLVTIGDNVVTMPTTNNNPNKVVGMVFSTLVSHGLVVNARNDYLSSAFHHALRSSSAELLSVGDGHHVEEAEILIRCEERASLPYLTFKHGNENNDNDVFAVFDGEEYFPTVLTKGDRAKLLEGNTGRKTLIKVKKEKWWKRWFKKKAKWSDKEKLEKAKKGEQWCSTRDFIQFRQTKEDEEEIWQLGLGFMKKYVIEFEVGNDERGHRIGIAPSKGEEIKLPKKRLKKIQARYNYNKNKLEYK